VMYRGTAYKRLNASTIALPPAPVVHNNKPPLAQVAQNTQANRALRAKLHQCSAALSNARAEVADVKRSLAQRNETVARLRHSIRGLCGQLGEMRSEIERAKSQLVAAQGEANQHRAAAKQHETNLDAALSRLAHMAKEYSLITQAHNGLVL